jgi:hypothetical protein
VLQIVVMPVPYVSAVFLVALPFSSFCIIYNLYFIFKTTRLYASSASVTEYRMKYKELRIAKKKKCTKYILIKCERIRSSH